MTESYLRRVVLCAACLFAVAVPTSAFDKLIDSPMYKRPDLPKPHIRKVFPEGAKALWLKVLAQPEADGKCRAAGAIALAQRRGYKGLESTIPFLIAELDRPEQSPAARLAVAEALIALEAKDAAPSLLRQAQAGSSDLRELVEPVLAEWHYRPAYEVWLARLAEPATPQRSLRLAIRNLGTVKEAAAAERLLDLALSQRVGGPIRLEAARSLAELRSDGLEKDAAELLRDPLARSLVNRLVAATLLQQHRSPAALKLLLGLAQDAEPAVATLAVVSLDPKVIVDPKLVDPKLDVDLLKQLLGRPDANLRKRAVDVLNRVPSAKHIGLLAILLDDPDTEVRIKARESLRELADNKEWHDHVIQQGERILATKNWRGLEQATILLTRLEDRSITRRLVGLLEFDRPEVFVTAAWGLRKLDDPAQLPAVHAYVTEELPRLRAGRRLPNRTEVRDDAPFDHQLSQLNQFLGQRKYSDAEGVLREFIPKHGDRLLPESRAAAVWALGMIHEGKGPADLPPLLEARLNDLTSIPPEADQVRLMSAISLGRMRAESALESLQKNVPVEKNVPFARPSGSAIHNACGWAVAQIKKEVWPEPTDGEQTDRDWFLKPDK